MRRIRRALQLTVLLAMYLAGLVVYLAPYSGLGAVVVLLGMAIKRGGGYTSHGTAKWATIANVSHMLNGVGLIIGYIAGRPSRLAGLKALFSRRLGDSSAVSQFLESCRGAGRKQSSLVRLNQAVHVSVYAPTGVGKGVSCILPFLLTCPESCVVIDFKGENAIKSAQHRAKAFGHQIVLLDPFDQVSSKHFGRKPDTYNPLQFVSADSPHANDECNAFAKAMVIRTGEEKDTHWLDMSETFIGGMTAVTVAQASDADKHLQTVRSLLSNREKMQMAVEMMKGSPTWNGLLARRANLMSNSVDKELSSTLTSTNRHMQFLDTTTIAENTMSSSFDPAGLLGGKMTIYLILPLEHISTQAGLLRLWFGSLLRTVIRGGLQEHNKVHYVCDEANSLGKMDQISDMLAIGRGYGIRMQLYYQDCGQLKRCWPNGADQSLLANTTQVFFGVNDNLTAEYVSTRLGEHTIVVSSGGSSTGGSEQRSSQGVSTSTSTNSNSNWQLHGRKLLKPEEVMALSPRTAITFAPGVPPIATQLVRYYEPSFGSERPIGALRAAFETACLLLAVSFVAALFTNLVFFSNQR